jgi:hypothetical protein
MTAVLLLVGCGDTSNMPYEPDTPAPPAHEGTFVSDHGTMTFNGDGKEITIDFDTALAEMTGLPEGEHTGTYVFLSGDLPPVGSVDVRYDVAHELAITIDETRVVVDVGIAAEDGSTASVGTNIVTTDRIPVLVKPEDKWETVMFEKK